MRVTLIIIGAVFLLCCLMAIFMTPQALNAFFQRFWLAAGNICSFFIIVAFFGFIAVALYRWATRR